MRWPPCHPARTASANRFPTVHPPRPMHQNDACCVLVPYLHRDAHGLLNLVRYGPPRTRCAETGFGGLGVDPARTASANRFPTVHPPRPMHQNDACCVLFPYLHRAAHGSLNLVRYGPSRTRCAETGFGGLRVDPARTAPANRFPTVHPPVRCTKTMPGVCSFLTCIVRRMDRITPCDTAHHAHGAPKPVTVAHVPPRETRFRYRPPLTHLASNKTLYALYETVTGENRKPLQLCRPLCVPQRLRGICRWRNQFPWQHEPTC